MPLKVMQNRNPHNCSHTEATRPHVGSQHRHHLLRHPQGLKTPVPTMGTHTHTPGERQQACWRHTRGHTNTLRTPAAHTLVTKYNPDTSCPDTGNCHTHTENTAHVKQYTPPLETHLSPRPINIHKTCTFQVKITLNIYKHTRRKAAKMISKKFRHKTCPRHMTLW